MQDRGRESADESPSSVYSEDERSELSARIPPLRIKKTYAVERQDVSAERRPNVLQEYAAWTNSPSPPRANSPTRSGCESHASLIETRTDDDDARLVAAGAYSPLAPFFRDDEQATARKGRKVMVGYNGWLERTDKSHKKASPPKKGGILDAIKKMAKEVVSA